ncbi:hypothetical protein ACFX2I_006257 [Malus domestica]
MVVFVTIETSIEDMDPNLVAAWWLFMLATEFSVHCFQWEPIRSVFYSYFSSSGYTKTAKYYYTLPNDRTYKLMVADSDFWTLNRVVLVYIVDDVQLINSAPYIEIQASANSFDIPHRSAPNIEIQASTNSFDIPHMSDPFGIFEGFLKQAYEGDREQDNLVEVEKTKGKYTSGKCNGNRSGSSSSYEGEQPVKWKSKNKMPKLIPFRSDLDIKNPQFRTGMIFSNRKEFKQAVTFMVV